MTPEQLAAAVLDTARAVLTERGLDPAQLPAVASVERPRNPEHGDYSTNLALQVGKRVGLAPRDLAQAIISFRQSNGFLPNIAWLLKVPGVNRDILKQLAPRVTVRSETFRIFSEGKVGSSGVVQRVQEIVRVGLRELTTVSYREDDL